MVVHLPAPSAQLPEGQYYRLVKSDPTTAGDFESMFEQNPVRVQKNFPNQLCSAMGLSLLKDIEDARQITQIIPQLGTLIARLEIGPEHGLIAPTPSYQSPSHHTWWQLQGFISSSLAIEVLPDSKNERS